MRKWNEMGTNDDARCADGRWKPVTVSEDAFAPTSPVCNPRHVRDLPRVSPSGVSIGQETTPAINEQLSRRATSDP